MNEEMYPNSVESVLAQPNKGMGGASTNAVDELASMVSQPNAKPSATTARGSALDALAPAGTGVSADPWGSVLKTAGKAGRDAAKSFTWNGARAALEKDLKQPSQEPATVAQDTPKPPQAPVAPPLAPATPAKPIIARRYSPDGTVGLSYAQNGVTYSLDPSLDVNDEAATSAAMNRMNSFFGMMDNAFGAV